MNLSYWEEKTWLSDIDFAIIGSGIVGLSCALSLRKKFQGAKIVVFEKGILPSGASTKNAGFACFGSMSEILDDLQTHTEEELIQLVSNRVEGLQLLRENLGDAQIDYQQNGGYELFAAQDQELFENCMTKLTYVNDLLKAVFSDQNEVFSVKKDPFLFKNINNQVLFNHLEGQLDTGKMMNSLIKKCILNDIFIMNSCEITSFSSENDQVHFQLNAAISAKAKQLFIATNGFAKQFLDTGIQPARAQVLITKPIKDLKIKGTFHLDRGYYYFRNIQDRILFGGGRHLDFKSEETTELGLTNLVQEKLEEILRTTILPNIAFEIDTRWSGIMGVGDYKKPILKEVRPNVYCGVRLGGMGVAIGSTLGKQLADFV